MRKLAALLLCCSLLNGCATIRRHPYAFAMGAIAAGAATGILLGRQAHCNHYEYGNSGVNVPCPKDPTPDGRKR